MAQFTLKQIEAFVKVTDLGSFRRAAERLNTTQPNISARISALEDRLGLRLMQRDAGAVRLTPAGARMINEAREVLRAIEGFALAAAQDHLIDGVLRLGVTELIVHTWLGPFLRALKRRFPAVDVDLTVDFSTTISAALHNRTLDLALQTGPFNSATSGMVDLGEYPLTWVAAPSLDVGDITDHPVLSFARGTVPFQQMQAHFSGNNGPRLVPSTNLGACRQMTLDGLGVACLPHAMITQDLATGDLVALYQPWCPDPLRFAARYDAVTAPAFVTEAAQIAGEIAGQHQ